MRKLIVESQIDFGCIIGHMLSDKIEHMATVRCNERSRGDDVSFFHSSPKTQIYEEEEREANRIQTVRSEPKR